MFTYHFKKRLKQRTNIKDVDSFCERVLSEKDKIKKIDILSTELNSHPEILNKIFRNPHQRVWFIDWENLYLFEENQYFKTLINKTNDFIPSVSGVELIHQQTHHHLKRVKLESKLKEKV